MISNKCARKISTSVLSVVMAVSLTGCGDAYNDYASAYNKVTSGGGMEAKFDVDLEMNGETVKSTGDFKLDTSDGNNILYYEMTTDGNDIIQFSDGEYIYTNNGDIKTKLKIGTTPSGGNNEKDNAKSSDSEFNTSAFLSEFSSFLEAGKIKDLGLLTPIAKAAVKSISKDGNTYSLEFSQTLVEKYLNTLVQNETGKSADDTIQINELKDFAYKAVESNGIITGVEYSGVLVIDVPGSLMSDGNAAQYECSMDINITFVNPGQSISVSLPSTEGYQEVK